MYGKLTNHGSAPFEHKEHGSESYFITLSNRGEERTFWSLGFEEAISQANIETGDTVSFTFVRKEIVTLPNGKRAHRSFFSAQKIEKQVTQPTQTSQSSADTRSPVARPRATYSRNKSNVSMFNIAVMVIILLSWIGFAAT